MRRRTVKAVVIGEPLANIGIEALILKNNPAQYQVSPIATASLLTLLTVSSLSLGDVVQRTIRQPSLMSVTGLGLFHCANLEMLILNLSVGLIRPFFQVLETIPLPLGTVRLAVCAAVVIGAARDNTGTRPAVRLAAIVFMCLGQAWLAEDELVAAVALVALGALIHRVTTALDLAPRHLPLLPSLTFAALATATPALACTSQFDPFVMLCVLVATAAAAYTYRLDRQLYSVYSKGQHHAQA